MTISDGKKFTEELPKRVPSLFKIVSFVRSNMFIWSFNPKNYDQEKGIIVSRGSPPIKEYKGIQIISVNDIEKIEDSLVS